MHELGVLYQALKAVNKVAMEQGISRVKHITLEVGVDSGFVPAFFLKLFPAASDSFSLMHGAVLKISSVSGKGLFVKEIGY